MKIKSKLVATILLAAVDFRAGKTANAKALLQAAAQDPDFDETVQGLADAVQQGDDIQDEDMAQDFDQGMDELDEEVASLTGRSPSGRKAKWPALSNVSLESQDSPGDPDLDNDEEQRGEGIEKEMASTPAARRRVRANLLALASAAQE